MSELQNARVWFDPNTGRLQVTVQGEPPPGDVGLKHVTLRYEQGHGSSYETTLDRRPPRKRKRKRKTMDEPTEFTNRGFGVYGHLTDNRGHDIRVQESSAADAAYVWIFTGEGNDSGSDPHLSVEQAKRLRDMLDAFIAHRGGGSET